MLTRGRFKNASKLLQPAEVASTSGFRDTRQGWDLGIRWEFAIPGPLEVRRGGAPVRGRRARQRALLALLLCRATRVTSRDQLIDELTPLGTPHRSAHSPWPDY
jgi:hypothetical protein